MRYMQAYVVEPRWAFEAPHVLPVDVLFYERNHPRSDAVLVTPAFPRSAHCEDVVAQSGFVTLPLQHGGMVLPARLDTETYLYDLQTLDSLLPKALPIEALSSVIEVGEWEEGDQAQRPLQRPSAQASLTLAAIFAFVSSDLGADILCRVSSRMFSPFGMPSI